jgi:hypothetical protein
VNSKLTQAHELKVPKITDGHGFVNYIPDKSPSTIFTEQTFDGPIHPGRNSSVVAGGQIHAGR